MTSGARHSRRLVERRRPRRVHRWKPALFACSLVTGTGLASGAGETLQGSTAMRAGAAANVVDRTLVCTTGVRQGKRSIEVIGHAAFRKGGRFEWLASAYVSAPGKPVASRVYYLPTLAGVFAGWPLRPDLTSGSLGVNETLCRRSRARIPLTELGLAGGPKGPYLTGGPLECPMPNTVLVRVRAVFFEPTALTLSNNGTFLQATERMKKGQLAVRTPSGKPLVYGEVYDSGKARLFTAKTCS